MTQITQAKLNDLNVIQLYEHYGALERSLPILSAESQDLARAEMETCAALRSEKIDRIYYALSHHEDILERIKKEKDLITKANLYHMAQVKGLKNLLSYLRRVLPVDENKIRGKNYQFTLSRKRELTVTITSELEDWTPEEQEEFCILEEVTTTKEIVVRSISGQVLSQETKPTTKTTILPNLDALRNAYKQGKAVPNGVKIVQDYSVRAARIYGESRMDLEASEYPGHLFPEVGSTEEC